MARYILLPRRGLRAAESRAFDALVPLGSASFLRPPIRPAESRLGSIERSNLPKRRSDRRKAAWADSISRYSTRFTKTAQNSSNYRRLRSPASRPLSLSYDLIRYATIGLRPVWPASPRGRQPRLQDRHCE